MEDVEVFWSRDCYSCVCKGEDRHDEEVYPRGQGVFKAVAHSHGVCGCVADVSEHLSLNVVREVFFVDVVVLDESSGVYLALLEQVVLAVSRLGRYQEGHNHTAHSGVDAGVVEQCPHGNGRNEIEPRALFSHLFHDYDAQNQNQGQAQQEKVDAAAVEYGDYQYGYKVIGDGKGCKEDLQRDWNLVAENGEYAYCKGDICGCRDSPSTAGRRSVVDCHIDHSRSHYATECGDNRHYGLFGGGELS